MPRPLQPFVRQLGLQAPLWPPTGLQLLESAGALCSTQGHPRDSPASIKEKGQWHALSLPCLRLSMVRISTDWEGHAVLAHDAADLFADFARTDRLPVRRAAIRRAQYRYVIRRGSRERGQLLQQRLAGTTTRPLEVQHRALARDRWHERSSLRRRVDDKLTLHRPAA